MEVKASYAVMIMRRGGYENLSVLETENFDDAHTLWKELTEKWVTSLGKDEPRPFVLEKPVVTAFDPGLIAEINVVPFIPRKETNNPYEKKMREEGFSKTFGEVTKGGEMLDRGYKL